jgi:hypothetical protein
MRGKLIKTKNQYILSVNDEDLHKFESAIDTDEYGWVIADEYGVDILKLSKQNCDEIFGVVDVEKLAEEEYKSHASNEDLYGDSEELQLAYKAGVVDGFNKAMELNKDKVFSVEDMKKACSLIFLALGDGGNITTDEIIQSIQQPTEIEVEIECHTIKQTKVYGAIKGVKGSGHKITTTGYAPKLDDNNNLILRRI